LLSWCGFFFFFSGCAAGGGESLWTARWRCPPMKTLGRCGLLDWSRSTTWREAEARGDRDRRTWNCTCSVSTDLAETADPDREGEGLVLFTGERDRLTA
jgi:hypothetical protein